MYEVLSRVDAALQGSKRFFTGVPCKRGHVSERLTSTGACIECSKIFSYKWREENPQYYLEYRDNNREKAKEYSNDYYKANREKLNADQVKYRERNQHRLTEYHSNYRNRPEVKAKRNARLATWRSTAEGKATKAIHRMVRRTLNGELKTQRSQFLIGYTIKDLMDHLELHFEEGMNWDNFGEWHIDHVVPVSFFVEKGIFDPKIVNNLDNLQPIWAKDNLKKRNNLPENTNQILNWIGVTR